MFWAVSRSPDFRAETPGASRLETSGGKSMGRPVVCEARPIEKTRHSPISRRSARAITSQTDLESIFSIEVPIESAVLPTCPTKSTSITQHPCPYQSHLQLQAKAWPEMLAASC